ncbi:hypothetical protein GLOIN_2v1791831 [Rhizophagus clarus]|uniref:Uncharacterized protein n=1 Tax=Rhizophagus clarus TaxID=94130 RepID=A0A8H3LEG0_9GLOM|nr:hypothetical protein GLOIN_2v1791831 [Rhizophagus clarus]
MSIEAIDNKFSDLFDAITLGQYNNREVKVFIRREKSENWREVDNELNQAVPAILSLIGILKKYTQYLNEATIIMTKYHHSNESAHSPKNNGIIRAVIWKPSILYGKSQKLKNLMYSYIQKVTLAVLCMLYFNLTSNAAVSSNSISHDNKFNTFWDEIEAYFNKQNLLTVDKRKHETILYIPLALSVCDLCKIIIEKLHTIHGNPLPFTIHIPSEEWIYDKHKVPIGKDIAVSIGIQNWHFMVDQNKYFWIILQWSSFVSYKDTTIKPSSAIKYSTKFLNVFNIQYEYQAVPPILCFYTDERPDHQCNYRFVQIALIAPFLQRDFDMLIAVCTAPNHSWINPAKCIISILNLGLQGIVLKRNQMSPKSKALFKTTNTLDDIRKKA